MNVVISQQIMGKNLDEFIENRELIDDQKQKYLELPENHYID